MALAYARPVSVIVLTWNCLEVTKNCLRTLLDNTTHPDFQVMVVDNGSTDGTPDWVASIDGVSLIANGENLGFVRGNNVGIEASTGDVVLLNNDTEIIQPDWLERMQELACSADDIGLVGCRLVNADGRLVHAGTYMPLPSFWGQEYPGDEADIGQYPDDRPVEGVIAACVYIKRAVIDKIGGLDTDYFSYFEDTDYCLKAARAGFQTWCCGGVTVKHLENASTAGNRMDFSGTFRKSRDVFLSKWKTPLEERYTSRLTWHSFISGRGLYSRASAKLLWALDRAGVDVNLGFLEGAERAELDDFRINDMKNRPADRDRPQVLFGPAGMLSRADGSYNIAYVFTPYDRFDEAAVKEMNALDEVWVTSESQEKAAVASGVKRDIQVMPLGVDPDYFHPGIKSCPLSGRFAFLANLEWGPGFAGPALLGAFTDEFSADEKVVLVMNVASPVDDEAGAWASETAISGGSAEVEEAVEALSLPMNRAPVVFVVDHEIAHYQSGSLYRSADCVVVPDRSAEPGTVAIESLACGVPVLAIDFGSSSGLIDGSAMKGIPCDLAPAPGAAAGLKWADPSRESLRKALREAFEGSEEAKAKALNASEGIRFQRSWDEVARLMKERLDAIARR
jgi:hypothetical protein